MAKIAQPPVPHKAYRHFAVITVVLTLLLALFASGENREAVAEQIEAQERAAHLQRVSAERTRAPRLARREDTGQNRFAGGDMQQFGKPMDQLGGGGGGSSSSVAGLTGARRTGEATVIPGYSRAYLDSLTEDQYRQLLNNVREAGLLSAEEREQSLANLANGSQRRSGVATPSEALVH